MEMFVSLWQVILHFSIGDRCKSRSVQALWLCFLCLIILCTFSVGDDSGCILHTHDLSNSVHDQEKETELLKVLNPLKGHTFVAKEENYTYTLGICTDLGVDALPGVGLIQREKTGDKKNYSLGSYKDVEIMGGTDWILLTYYNGTAYHSKHCNGTNRTSYIMVICDPTTLKGEFRILEERRKENSDNCFYLFELGSNVTCIVDPPHSLSSGSVFCIIIFTFIGIYLLLGFLYQRIVVGAKGLEQIPNYAFWRSFGNLQADGCDYICRCGPRQESQAYRGIDDRIRTDEERDDQLLNM